MKAAPLILFRPDTEIEREGGVIGEKNGEKRGKYLLL
jgi:hypothetical protein